ncbi:MAG TPA: hypothetical protein EYP58_04305, partial [bacterium (Candidatus Stahlbacteria)]|nr:hypothetical protein [Candidatus Stahlbacteria bacterium]
NNNCDIFVSIHCNSHEKESAHGTETSPYSLPIPKRPLNFWKLCPVSIL